MQTDYFPRTHHYL